MERQHFFRQKIKRFKFYVTLLPFFINAMHCRPAFQSGKERQGDRAASFLRMPHRSKKFSVYTPRLKMLTVRRVFYKSCGKGMHEKEKL